MKIKNIQMVAFLNAFDSISKKSIPSRLYYAMSCNMKVLSEFVQPYQEAHEKAKEAGEQELAELINQEIDVNIQTVPLSTLDLLDNGEKYDVLMPRELESILFMFVE